MGTNAPWMGKLLPGGWAAEQGLDGLAFLPGMSISKKLSFCGEMDMEERL